MWAFLVTLAFTLYMTGMIWSMQILEYPLFALVGPKEFPAYHWRHNRGLPFLVILPSLAAFVSAVVLIFTRPARLPLWASIEHVKTLLRGETLTKLPVDRAGLPGKTAGPGFGYN